MIVRMPRPYRPYNTRSDDDANEPPHVDLELFEACDQLGYPEAAAQWDASDIAGGASIPDLRGKAIRLYPGQRTRQIGDKNVVDIFLRICIGEHQQEPNAEHQRYDWSKSLGWLDINQIEADVREAVAKRVELARESAEAAVRDVNAKMAAQAEEFVRKHDDAIVGAAAAVAGASAGKARRQRNRKRKQSTAGKETP